MAKCLHGIEVGTGCQSCNPGLRLVGAARGATHSGLQILPGELIKAEPFNAMAKKIAVLEVLVRELAKRTGMTDSEMDELLKSIVLRIATAEKLMED